jgi:hypothetical protein
MCKLKIAVAILAAVFAFVPMQAHAFVPPPPPVAGSTVAPVAPWLIIGCAGGIIFSALIANGQGRQLTAAEAATCGLLFLLNPPAPR